MGIKNLWSALRDYTSTDSHISQFAGKRVAVDMYVFLHRSVLGCVDVNMPALEQYLQRKYPRLQPPPPGAGVPVAAAEEEEGEVTLQLEELLVLRDTFIDYMVNCVEGLQRYGVIPVCVFDGAEMPIKRQTDADRGQRRDDCFCRALLLLEEMYLKQGCVRRSSPDFERVLDHLSKAVDISTEMAHVIIQVLREERQIECLVAPYEADAEIAYLCREGYVQAGISEDSDLIAYFCPCVISKLNPNTGACHVIRPPDCAPLFCSTMAAAADGGGGGGSGGRRGGGGVTLASSPTGPQLPAGGTVPGAFAYHQFLLGCIMSGCDYASNLSGIGVKKAFKLVASTSSLLEILAQLHRQYGFTQERLDAYRLELLSAFYCFAHHIVYCPRAKTLRYYHPPPSTVVKTELIGEMWPAETARSVCGECLFDPQSLTFYKGIYKDCLQRYLRRTRQGQTSLRAFSGFQSFHASKVVVRLSESGRPAPQQQRSAAAGAFSQPLRKVQEAQGFHGGSARSAPLAPTATIIRSKHFLRGCAVVTDHHWSDSDSETAEGTEASPSSSSAPLPDSTTAKTSDTAPPTPAGVCACPYGYWQCNERHSIFHKCFLGKPWVRGELPAAPRAPASTRPEGQRQQGAHPAREAKVTAPPPPPVWPNFRPPRSTVAAATAAAVAAPPTCPPPVKRGRAEAGEEIVVVTDDSREASCAEAPPPPSLSERSLERHNHRTPTAAACGPAPPPSQEEEEEETEALGEETGRESTAEKGGPAEHTVGAEAPARERAASSKQSIPRGALRAATASLFDQFTFQKTKKVKI